jgi:hypothetical protein
MAVALDAGQFWSLEKPLYKTEECLIDTSNLMACALELQSASPSKQLANHEALIENQPRTDSQSPLVSAISGPPTTGRMTLRASTRIQRDPAACTPYEISALPSSLPSSHPMVSFQLSSRCACFFFIV